MLNDLEQLAREGSSEKRRELLNGVTSLFLDGAEHHTDREVTLYADVVLQVLDDVDRKARVEYSNHVADHKAIPRSVARRLAHDEIEVAQPVLLRSPVLTEVDLVKVAERRSQDHLLAITQRASLSEAVTDSLIRRGNNDVVRQVSANTGASFSASGLTTLATRSEHDDHVRTNLLNREDLREEILDKVLPLISSDYASKLKLLIDQAEDEVLDELAQSTAAGVEGEQSQAPRLRLETKALIKQVLDGSVSVDEAITYLCGQGRFSDLITLLAKVAGLPENVVSNVLFKASNEPVAIICRAVGAGHVGCKAVLDHRAQKLRLPQSHVERGMREFAALSEETAKRSLRFVKVRAAVA